MIENSVFISSQELGFNGRFIKCRKAVESLPLATYALQLCDSINEAPETVNYISPPTWPNSNIFRAINYRIQKRKALSWLKHKRPSILHAIDYVALDVAAEMKRKHGGKLIFDACEFFAEATHVTPETKNYIDKVIRRSAPHVDAVIAPSSYLRDYYIEHYPGLPHSIIVNNAPVINKPIQDDGRLRRAVNLDKSQTILLFHGALIAERGLEALVETANKFMDSINLVLMGYGALHEDLMTLAARTNKIANRKVVHIIPPVPNNELLSWVAGADFGLIPYSKSSLNHKYCTPNKLYEYAGAGVPILASDLPSLKKYVHNAGIGKIVKPEILANDIGNVLSRLKSSDISDMKKKCAVFTQNHSGLQSQNELRGLYRELTLSDT